MKAGELYRYPEGQRWCRHGLLLVEESRGGLMLRDTYWGWGGDELLSPEQVAGKIEFILDISNARRVQRHDWEQFREEDRAYIPVGGGSEQYWVRKDAEPDSRLVEGQLLRAVAIAKSNLDSAKWRFERAHEELAEFQAKHSDPTPLRGMPLPTLPVRGRCRNGSAASKSGDRRGDFRGRLPVLMRETGEDDGLGMDAGNTSDDERVD